MVEHPKVFISYSHDSKEHRQWVLKLATKLVDNGVDVMLDQWDLGLGGDLTLFMERGIMGSDRVLVICTDSYVSKANAGKDGVGYERMIVTAELVQDLGTDKFIPVIRQASRKEKTPTFLGTRVYADFRNESQYDEGFDKLLHELHRVPVVHKPPLGKRPFAQLPEIPEQVESAFDAYSAAVKIARAGDVVGWKQLIKRIKPSVFNSLVQWWENELDERQPEHEELFEVAHKAVEIISPLISVALAGVESGRVQFRDQKSLLDDLLNIAEWNRDGNKFWVSIPHTLGYVYHSLHGSLCLNTNQLDLALSLAQTEIPIVGGTKSLPVWKSREIMGWHGLLGPNFIERWKYLVEAYEKWEEWLSPIFTDELEYRTSLVAYYMALHIHELASVINSGQLDLLNTSSYYPFNIPLTFLPGDKYIRAKEINDRAVLLLHRNSEAFTKLWNSLEIACKQRKYSWEDWICFYENWFSNSNILTANPITYLPDLFRNLFSE